jgi:hypothetical protein
MALCPLRFAHSRGVAGFGIRLDRICAVFQEESRHIEAAEATGPTQRGALFAFVTDVEPRARVEKDPSSRKPLFFVAEALRNGPWAAGHLVHDGGSTPRDVTPIEQHPNALAIAAAQTFVQLLTPPWIIRQPMDVRQNQLENLRMIHSTEKQQFRDRNVFGARRDRLRPQSSDRLIRQHLSRLLRETEISDKFGVQIAAILFHQLPQLRILVGNEEGSPAGINVRVGIGAALQKHPRHFDLSEFGAIAQRLAPGIFGGFDIQTPAFAGMGVQNRGAGEASPVCCTAPPRTTVLRRYRVGSPAFLRRVEPAAIPRRC